MMMHTCFTFFGAFHSNVEECVGVPSLCQHLNGERNPAGFLIPMPDVWILWMREVGRYSSSQMKENAAECLYAGTGSRNAMLPKCCSASERAKYAGSSASHNRSRSANFSGTKVASPSR